MPKFGPIKRRDLITYLRLAGFSGPESGGRHQFMNRGNLKLTIPNPHSGDISKELLAKILKQAGISKNQWENLR